jgi:hypothetical protein
MILLPQSPKCWDYRYVLPSPAKLTLLTTKCLYFIQPSFQRHYMFSKYWEGYKDIPSGVHCLAIKIFMICLLLHKNFHGRLSVKQKTPQ